MHSPKKSIVFQPSKWTKNLTASFFVSCWQRITSWKIDYKKVCILVISIAGWINWRSAYVYLSQFTSYNSLCTFSPPLIIIIKSVSFSFPFCQITNFITIQFSQTRAPIVNNDDEKKKKTEFQKFPMENLPQLEF